MGKLIDLIGMRFGRLIVISRSENNNNQNKPMWLCNCDCKNTTVCDGSHLRGGKINSCGCLQRDVARERLIKHGMKGTKIYRIWKNMKSRCNNPKVPNYKHYGGRGITVCKEWEESFETFYSDMNNPPNGFTLDRINNDKGYCLSNCRWATWTEQNLNKRKRSK